MSGRPDLEGELKAALSNELASTEGEFPLWGMSPQSRQAQAWPDRSMRSLLPRKIWVAAAATATLCLALGASLVRVTGPTTAATTSPHTPCDAFCGPTIWATAALDGLNVIGVGGSMGDQGSLVLVSSVDGGKTWASARPNAPALTSLAVAGGRLYGSTACLPTYPPEYGLASGTTGGFPSGLDHSFYPAPTSCLYYSDDRGVTWHDSGAGRVVDPTFADAMNGWAHSPYDMVGQTPTTLYSTADGGRTWHTELPPCEGDTPWIKQAIATGRNEGYLLCVGADDPTALLTTAQPWVFVHIAPGAARTTRWFTVSDLLVTSNVGADNFTMRADGTGWIYTYTYLKAEPSGVPEKATSFGLYRTEDGGSSWAPLQDASADWLGMRDVSFVSSTTGFAAVQLPTSGSEIIATTDGGRTWQALVTWSWSSLR
ncbi:MAG TPA: hypothetical protein VF349_03350 [Candidatus Limnocylindrales bacterium]